MNNFSLHRIDSIFIKKGFCSQRASKNFFLKNEIFVNGKRIVDGKFLVSYEDKVFFQNKIIEIPEDFYIVIDKPKGIVCSRVSDSHKTVFEWLKEELNFDFDRLDFQDLHCVGRLDAETTGLLILTTNGNVSNYITNPENKIQKTYEVILKDSVNSEIQKSYCEKANFGLILPAEKKSPQEKSSPAKIKWVSEKKCEITVTEGKFHEVRRIFRALGNEVVELRRIAIGKIALSSANNKMVYNQSTFCTLFGLN